MVLTGLALLAACSKSPTAPAALPSPGTLLAASAQAMTGVTSAHFVLGVKGSLTSLPIQSASGEVSRDGQAQASVDVTFGGATFSEDVIITGGTLYLKGITGGWTSQSASSFYDPTQLLDPTKGIPALLGQATGGKTLDEETLNSTPAYRLQATVPTGILQGLTDLAPGQSTVTATLWIARSGDKLLQVMVPFKIPKATADTVLTATLSDFNVPVSVKAPATS
jgi:lipoprotein LprG